MAKYKDIAKVIRERILNGTYPTGESLPEQVKLSKEFKTSRMTIQKALDLLGYEGLIYSKQGKGTFVKSNADSLSKLDTSINQYVGTTELFKNKASVSSKIIKNELRLPSSKEQDKLQLDRTDAVYDVIRVRYLDEAPYCIEHSIMPTKILGNLTDGVLKKSIYYYLEQQLNLKIGAAYRKISADKPNKMDQEYLKCDLTEPVLQVKQTVFLQNGKPFEYSTTRHRFDMGSITTINMGNTR
ncbi:GntR family transcriptional regulator [Pediococcus acidilactici]|uniref:GntR family transcriptional regulator n=1 Tax=Pediococcus TaxID=1253 RepID=UPI00071AF5F2|nr:MULTISPECIES: GntR family transcriptional regulator [Pediococcus]KAF0367774.1 UTRA domain-containing protein [Pediococcus acidilactici]KAF0518372.1 UTRA domain-containing protein [Pediococcus acidilactici]KSV56684.1 GntR family transcriptional regulator [Pediococcus acidilactici]MCT3036739.1 GntR family transcriptional regulator [Pediococcus acidilactici]MDD9322612.1 GntR family transcriptional regulator [Pediococcus acidilactici]